MGQTIGEVILETVENYEMNPEDINDGLCFHFAMEVAVQFDDADIAWNCDLEPEGIWGECWHHCFITYQGKFYDSECPDGVDDWKQLPFFIRLAAVSSL